MKTQRIDLSEIRQLKSVSIIEHVNVLLSEKGPAWFLLEVLQDGTCILGSRLPRELVGRNKLGIKRLPKEPTTGPMKRWVESEERRLKAKAFAPSPSPDAAAGPT